MSLIKIIVSVLVLVFLGAPAWAIHTSNSVLTPLEQKKFVKPELRVSSGSEPLEKVRHLISNDHANAQNRFRKKYGQDFHFHIDPRSGTATNIVGRIPFIPGNGKGNQISREQVSLAVGRTVTSIDAYSVAKLMKNFIQENQDVLNLDDSQTGPVKAEKITDQLWQLHATQEVNGIKVRGARLAATISHGNLVMLGTERWGNVKVNTAAKITADEALKLGFQYVDGQLPKDEILSPPVLEIVPIAPLDMQDGDRYTGPMGKGYEHRLVWTFTFKRVPEAGTWEVMIDARNGEILSFLDTNQYLTSSISGGVYPLTDTEICPAYTCCGVMQPDQPMPFADTGLPVPNDFTNSAGLFTYSSGGVVTTLRGKYVRIQDNCGPISESIFGSNGLVLGGANGQHDCVSGGSSAGNTAAARSAFYEINRVQEMARAYLPNNYWLNNRLTANLNIDQTCNAYWDHSTVNFFKSGGGCRNTGEIAQVFDHEWGHGLDENDGNGLSSPSESYADITAMYRLQTSCMGHGFFETQNRGCGQTADGTGYNTNIARSGSPRCALNCSGVRETDWDLLTGPDHTPDTPQNFVCSRCGVSSTGYNGPCGRQAHCESSVDTEAAWDFVARDLQSPPYNFEPNTAFIIATRIFFQAAGNIGNWHTCDCDGSTANGCGATNAYMQWLAVDDDDGDVTNGTPHMTALYNAFSRHGIACETPAPVNSGCAGAPTAAPVLTATPGNGQVSLSWTADPAATKYSVFRTEGVAGCNTGKTLIATVTGNATHVDQNLANDRQYCYSLMAVGSSDACFSPASACVCTTPALASHGSLQGIISNAGSGDPIQNAIVRVTGGYVTLTDSSGMYRFDDLPGGAYDLSVAAMGFRSGSAAGIVINNVSVTMNLVLETLPMVTMQGTVTDGSGHGWPLYASVEVIAPAYADIKPPGYAQSVHTDPVTGHYSVTLYQDTPYRVTVNGTGYNVVTRDITTAGVGSVENFSLTVDQETCAPGYGMLYGESFENGNGRYTRLSQSGSLLSETGLSDWQWGKPESGPYSAHSGKYVWATNLTGPFSSSEDTYLTSPDIDLSGNAGHPSVLSWWQWLNKDSPFIYTRASVDISNNSGASWTPFAYVAPDVVAPWSKQSLLLSTSYSVSTFRVRFHFESAQMDIDLNVAPGWYIDDITAAPQSGCQLQPGSLLVGYVTDAVTGAGLNGVTVTNDTGQTTASVATADDPGLNDGFYALFLPDGIHDLTARITGYRPQTLTGVSASLAPIRWQNITLDPLPPLTITTGTLPSATVGTSYDQSLTASGGLPPYAWSIYAGALPQGLSLNASTGVISGTPTTTGTFFISVRATDATGAAVTKLPSISLYNPLVITSGDLFYLPGTAYSHALEAAGGHSPYSWAIASGALPPGMVLESGTGIVSGTAPPADGATVTFQVSDADNRFSSKTLTLAPELVVTGYQPPDGAVVPITASVQATFSEPLDPASIVLDNFLISNNGRVTAISAGDYHTVALQSNGAVVAWGKNDRGQINVPAGLSGVTAVAAGSNHTLALKSDGTVAAWGANDYGQTTVPTDLAGVIAIAAGSEHSLALKSDGTVVAWGHNDYGQRTVPAGLAGVVAIAAGRSHSVALKGNGTVVAWGYKGDGEATVPAGLSGVTAIAAGQWHTLALKGDGTVVAWGYNNNGQTVVPAGLGGVVGIAAGLWHSVALKNDGTLVAWGLNNHGQTTSPAGLSGVTAVAAGANHTAVLKSDGTVAAWGDNSAGQATVPAALTPGGNKVSGALTYDAASLTVTFTPSVLLAANTRYNVTIGGFASQSGVILATPVTWSFNTHDLNISTAALPAGTVTAAYSTALAVSGGTAPYAWSIVSGTLPAGLSFDAATAVISGTPASTGTSSITFGVVDALGHSFSKTFTLAINSPVLTVASAALADGYSTSAYSVTLAATGGTPPYTWNITSGTLPSGLTLAGSTGTISGTPAATGARTIAVRVTDANNITATRTLTCTIYAKPGIATATLPFGTTGTAYGQTLPVTGGKAPFTWRVTSGRLPPGLGLGSATGMIAGSPTTAGSFTFTVQAADANATIASIPLTISVYQALTITTSSLPYAMGGSAYSQTLSATGGLAPYAWSISGSLPPGLTLDSVSGKISGSSVATGSYPLTVRVTDANTTSVSRAFSLDIANYLNITGHQPADGTMAPVSTSVQATFSDALAPAAVTSDSFRLIRGGAATSIVAGEQHTVALKSNGTAVAWGYDNYGQASVPGGLTSVVAIAAGVNHTLALRNDGTLVAWGESLYGKTAVPDGLAGVTAIAAGEYHSVALKNDGTVVVWGGIGSAPNAVPAGLSGVTAIAAGYVHTVALKSDGTVVAWGDNYYGQTTVPAGLTGVIAIAAGGFHTMALKSDGTVVAWGWNLYGQTAVPAGLTGVIAIAAGGFHTMALTSNGTVVAWGRSDNGQATVPAGLAGVAAVAAGGAHTVALKKDGTLVAWGSNGSGQTDIPAGLTPAGNAVSATVAHDPAARTLTLSPAAPLLDNTTYFATVAGVTSQAGVPLAAPVQWRFTTNDLSITTLVLPYGINGTGYSQSLGVTGGVAPYTWSIMSGSLPTGLSLNSATGLLAGTPTVEGEYAFTIRITDATTAAVTRPLTITIHNPLTITTSTLPFAVIGTAYNQSLAASGGPGPYIWSVTSGALPAGMILDGSTGVISGIPAVAGNFSVSVRAACGASSDTRQFSLTVKASAIRVPGVTARYFMLLQAAYGALADGETIEMQGADFSENLDFNRDLTVVLKGGYANDYSGIDSITTVRGSVIISRGTVVIDNLLLGP